MTDRAIPAAPDGLVHFQDQLWDSKINYGQAVDSGSAAEDEGNKGHSHSRASCNVLIRMANGWSSRHLTRLAEKKSMPGGWLTIPLKW
jgi:hypothetical protein